MRVSSAWNNCVTSLERARGHLRERFYQSVAETLNLLHARSGEDRRLVMAEVARTLTSTIDLPLVWIGRREANQSRIEIVAAAGTAKSYTSSLKLSSDENDPGGQGPLGRLYRQGGAHNLSIDDSSFAPWHERAVRYGFGSLISAVCSTREGGQISLSFYASAHGPSLNAELVEWAQRLVNELARFWNDHALLERNQRLARYRDAQRAIQQTLLNQPGPEAVYNTLVQELAEVAGAAAVGVRLVSDATDDLSWAALAGAMSAAMRRLPTPQKNASGPRVVPPVQAYQERRPIIQTRPASQLDAAPLWRVPEMAHITATGCWPLFVKSDDDPTAQATPVGVIVIITVDEDTFDVEMCRLIDEICDAAGVALGQHHRRHALVLEQQRQSYLASHDALTGLPNRRALDSHLEHILANARSSGHLVALGLLDLDDLKPINDRHGHAVGDRVLMEVANRLRASLRPEDYVARQGGDEFVLVFDQLRHEDDLDALLDRVGSTLQAPIVFDERIFHLSASLGMAIFPAHTDAGAAQLVRLADQAMYRVKINKRNRPRWWSLSSPTDGASFLSADVDGKTIAPYGELAARILTQGFRSLDMDLAPAMESYFKGLWSHEGTSKALAELPPDGVDAFKQRRKVHAQKLFLPELTLQEHHNYAIKAGRDFAASGVEEVWLLESMEMLRDSLISTLERGVEHDQRPLNIVLQRLSMEQRWELESMRALQRRRVAVLAELNILAWSAGTYLDLINGVVRILSAHDEIISCAVSRPDATGQMIFEAADGGAFTDYLRVSGGNQAPIYNIGLGTTENGAPSIRAWLQASTQRCVHYGTDSTVICWREQAASLGILSSVAMPLCPSPRTPVAVLCLYSGYVGGFRSEDQQAFVEQIKNVLDLALSRITPPRTGTELLPFFVRERWRTMVATDAVQMYYQPVVRLSDGCATELEALARLKDIDGEILAPMRFLPVLGADEFVQLFRQGLIQALACRRELVEAGHTLDMSINVPAAAVEDSRYVETAAAVLASSDCPPSAILLEILESPIHSAESAPVALAGMQALKALGVRLAEDDLGAGYSSLIRLRQWPFDRVKIDQAHVLQVVDDPLRTLRFIRQLIRLGHDLGLEVVVEGLETQGLVEAAMILGAGLGQGYALARPMPADQLPNWLARFHSKVDASHPLTALGALAAALFWEERLMTLPASPIYWEPFASATCAPGSYLAQVNAMEADLSSTHAAMHTAACNGPLDPTYRELRTTFMAKLIEQVRHEERRILVAAAPAAT